MTERDEPDARAQKIINRVQRMREEHPFKDRPEIALLDIGETGIAEGFACNICWAAVWPGTWEPHLEWHRKGGEA